METYSSFSRQLVSATESARGTAETLNYATDQDVIAIDLSDVSPDAGHDGGSNDANGTMIMGKSYAGKKQGQVTFSTDMKWSGDILVAPKNWRFFEWCGWRTEVNGVDPAKLIWDGRPSCKSGTMELPMWKCGTDPEGIADVLAGVAGTVSFGAEGVGMPIRANFTMTGKHGGRKQLTTGTYAPPAGFDTADCDVFLGGSVTKGATQIYPWTWSVDQGGDVQPVDKHDSTTGAVQNGIDYFHVVGAQTQFVADATRVDLTTIDNVNDLFTNVVDGSSVIETDHFTITLFFTQNISVEAGNNNETATDNVTMKLDKIEIIQKA